MTETVFEDQPEQALHKKQKSCPPKLSELIERAQFVPPDTKLPPLRISARKFLLDRKKLHLLALYELEKCLDKLPKRFYSYIYGRPVKNNQFFLRHLPDLSPWETYESIERYESFNHLMKTLRALTRFDQNLAQRTEPILTALPLPVLGRTYLIRDVGGKVQIKVDEISAALDGVELSRIRSCEVCQRIFWAGRLDQKCCTPKCSNINRVRRSRQLKQERAALYEYSSYKKGD